MDLTKRIPDQTTALINKGNPQEAQPPILICPSDSTRGRLYANPRTTWSLRFGKGNYAAYVSPEHIRNMRVFPGAMINEPQSLSRISDGTSKTLMLAEVRTRDAENDSRGVWAAAWAGGSLLGFDMHCKPPYSDVSSTYKANTPYSPALYNGVEPGLPPNTSSTWGNVDYIRECGDGGAAAIDGMPCFVPANRVALSAAPRSQHVGGVNASHVDGSVVWVADDIEQHLMARMVSINDAEGEVEGRQP